MSTESSAGSDGARRLEEWDSSPLPGGMVALSYPILRVGRVPASSGEAVAIALTADRAVIIRPADLGRFITAHSDDVIACSDAAQLHSVLEEAIRSEGDTLAIDNLWELSERGRLQDVSVIERLSELCAGGTASPAPAGRFELSPEDESRARALAESLPPGIELRLPEEAQPNATHAIEAVIKVFARHRLVLSSIECLAVDPGEDSVTQGTPTLGLYGRGRIAAGYAEEAGIALDSRSRDDMLEKLSERYRRAYSSLRASGQPWSDWLTRMPEDLLETNATRKLPFDSEKLGRWLDGIAGSLVDSHGRPLPLPRSVDGKLETTPERWGDYIWIDSSLVDWADLVSSWRLARALKSQAYSDGRLRPKYEVMPRVRSISPDLRELRRLAGNCRFKPGNGHRFLVVRIPHLEIACLAAHIGRWEGDTDLRDKIERGFSYIESATEELVHSAFRTTRRSGGGPPPVKARKVPYRIDRGDLRFVGPQQAWIEERRKIAEAIFWALCRGLDHPQVRIRLRLESELDFDPRVVQKHWGGLVSSFDEFSMATRDETFDLMLGKLRCDASELTNLIEPRHRERGFALLRRSIAGKSGDRGLLQRMIAICYDAETRSLLEAGGSDALYRHFFMRPGRDFNGRFDRVPSETVSRSTPHLGRFDGTIKAVAYGLARAGLRLVALEREEFIIESPESRAETDTARAEDVANRVVTERLGAYAPQCTVDPCESW